MGSGVTGWRKHARAIGGVVAFTGLMSLLKLHEWVASRIEDLEQVEATERPVSWNDWSRNLIVDIISRLLAELKAVCDEDRVVVGVEERTFHAKPWHSHFAVKAIPDIVVYPKSQEEVVAVVNACAKYKVPMIPFAGGTSMEGQSMTPHKGVSINMKLMKRVKELHLEDMDVVVESGIGWIELNEFLKPHGLFFPLDPGPGASIGGMCATRCSGSLAVRYGTMRDNVISLKCILPNGDVVKTAARARKSAAGYDLTRLLIGSEGTLGLITEVTLRLQKIPEASVVAMCNFKSIGDATAVAIATMHSGIQVSRVELLDEMMMNAINIANGKNYPTEPTLMFEFVGTEAYALEQTSRVEKIVQAHNGSDFVYADSEMEKEELWKIRKGAFWSSFSLRPGAEGMTTDVCVPLSRLAECISTSKERLLASSLPHVLVAHAGDGNFHVCIFFDKNNEEEVKEALEIADGIVHLSLSMEGTCTGEHGVGVGKMKYLEKEHGSAAMTMMGSIKRAIDPSNLMNPGKLIPEKFCY
ncbi:D-lactate dehydrogenase [cytochrome], mitochondrial isoform X6 [Physcomitrium patens]|uniref:D-lactate dehydrogenase (cytochrome) n=1 Tax=Physcomitrium patens TaxID=3218 RepID=A0A2K1IVR2_PHYPA|nr:D-lactate dehydrogenase [cytochrome], mitochondrial-like isoform X5 [Physcomitrium patens]PNR33348.1 hypothetical protein PHYPA_025291 [Physcomitrium patens]|eukprot:XP_024357604.1 D-lactate dehydrogenase [cytochrome], mitochondrial-like isoform X5 [Physcomitrella patens]